MKIRIERLPADPICARASIGGSISEGMIYCTYRGQIQEIRGILRRILDHLEQLPEQPVNEKTHRPLPGQEPLN